MGVGVQQLGASGTMEHTHNGSSFNLTVDSGDRQVGPAGAWLPVPLVARVTNLSGVALVNAPVTFTIAQQNSGLALTSGGATAGSLTARTDSTGRATVYCQQ